MTTNEASPETDISPPFACGIAKQPQIDTHLPLHDRALNAAEVKHNVRSKTGTCAARSSSSLDEHNALFSRPESHREEGVASSSSWTECQELCYLQKA